MSKNGNRKDSKEAICLALFLLLKKYPYDEISVKQISERAGVSRMSFYRYFKNKEDVFIYYSDEKFIEFNDIIHEKHIANVKDMITEFLLFIKQNAESVQVLVNIDKYAIMLPQYEKYVAYLYKKFIRIVSAVPSVLDKYAISFLSGGLYSTTLKWFKDGAQDDPIEIGNELYELFEKYILQNEAN